MSYLLQPPKGQFTKYILSVDKLSESKTINADHLLRRASKMDTKSQLSALSEESEAEDCRSNILKVTARESELSHKLEVYTILGLEPGEAYK